ncbi:ATP-dependent Clp protease adaptor ClpS [bacterium]|nr:ATP-dependent Clp protease adaptor ClpS [bacterium]
MNLSLEKEVLVAEEQESNAQVDIDLLWSVDLFNDEVHTFEEVIHQLMKATNCTRGRAEDLSWTVHREGKANVFQSVFEDCLRVAGILNEIGLATQIKG